MNWKDIYLEKFRNLLIYTRKGMDKSWNAFDQLLIYWKIQLNRNNLQV